MGEEGGKATVYTHLWISCESRFDPPKSPLKRETFNTFGSVPSFLRRVREDQFDLCVHSRGEGGRGKAKGEGGEIVNPGVVRKWQK
jgi:hypothetical protein